MAAVTLTFRDEQRAQRFIARMTNGPWESPCTTFVTRVSITVNTTFGTVGSVCIPG